MSTGIVYCAHCLVNGKKYIGKTIQDLEKRIQQHKRHSKKLDYVFYRAVNMHGWDNFIWGIVEECSVELLNEKEMYWISYYKSNNKNHGYNMTFGGEFGIPRELLSEMGKRNGNYVLENKIGIFSYSKSEKSSIGKLGGSKALKMGVGIHSLTTEQKSYYGKLGAKKSVEKSQRHYKLISPDGIIHEGYNLTKFCRNNNLTPSAICNVLNGKCKHHKGWTAA